MTVLHPWTIIIPILQKFSRRTGKTKIDHKIGINHSADVDPTRKINAVINHRPVIEMPIKLLKKMVNPKIMFALITINAIALRVPGV
jgi:hypothetical protein